MRKVCGVGVNDTPKGTTKEYKSAYSRWNNMLQRCYDATNKKYKSYGGKGVYVCDDWLFFSNYLKWYLENYIEGYVIDKDILGIVDKNGVKYYSPITCKFIEPLENSTNILIYKGVENSKSHSMEWYEKNSVPKSSFRTTCKIRGWDFNDFKYVWLGGYNSSNVKVFLFFHKESKNLIPHEWSPIFKYQTISINHSNFLNRCKKYGFSVNDFIRINSGIKEGKKLKYYYVHIDRSTPY